MSSKIPNGINPIITDDIFLDCFLSRNFMAKPKLTTVVLDFVGTDGVSIVDIPRALSLVNRQSYRSGYVYAVDFIEVIADQQDNQEFTIGKIPENYNTLGAYKLGWTAWRHQRAMAIAESGIEPGKWSDFKPWYNEDHADATLTELMPRGLGAGYILQHLDVTGAEWNRADLEVNDFNAASVSRYSVGMLGASDDTTDYGGLIDAWGKTRSATLAPDPMLPGAASLSWITSTGPASDDMTGQVIELIEAENDYPPYANQVDPTLSPTYVGNAESASHGMMADQGLTGTTGRALALDGGLFPLGYVLINTSATSYVLRIHCTRGEYKGVAALKLGDFR